MLEVSNFPVVDSAGNMAILNTWSSVSPGCKVDRSKSDSKKMLTSKNIFSTGIFYENQNFQNITSSEFDLA